VVRIPKNIPVYISAKWVRLEADDTGVVAGDRVNLRATPDTKYGALGVSYRGTVVKVLDKTNGWFKIVPPDTAYGWMYKTQISRIGTLAEHGDVDAPAYQALQKKREEKKAVAVNYALAEALMGKATDAAFEGNVDLAIQLLEELGKKAPGTPLASSALGRLEKLRTQKEADRKWAQDQEKKERKRQKLDRKYLEDLKKQFKEDLERLRPKKPVWTTTGTLKGMGMMVLRRGTHKIVDENGHTAYTLRAAPNSGIDLYHWKYYEKKVGIVGTVKCAAGWPYKIIEVRRIELLDKKEE
jgi:hypothetical protein